MLADKNTVHKLIPQDKPMIMVDQLLEHDTERTVTGFTVEKNNLFAENGFFAEPGLIENMAQSAALRTGWMGMQETGGGGHYQPPVGVIGAVKDFVLYRVPKVPVQLQTEVGVIASFSNATVVKALVRTEGELLAEAELKIFIQE
ncbi:MAG: hypothetical protein V2I47_09425 [Bacteroidales bacterium]|jgi:predicted hotdog family 3-hydroxylacyl-ACP dehydratase|nr:hypothetical protein [Bacteroidales bacterium]